MKKLIPQLRRLLEPMDVAFDHENFIRLLLRRQKRLTSRKENAYIKLELKRNAEARQLEEDLKETCPGENILPPEIRRTKAFAVIIVVLALAGGGYLFSLGRKWQAVPASEEVTYRFENKPLSELCEVIEGRYSVIVIFDRQEVGNYHFTGLLNTKVPLTEFLKKLKTTAGIEYYYDDGGILHFR